jgi:hypothetical protein
MELNRAVSYSPNTQKDNRAPPAFNPKKCFMASCGYFEPEHLLRIFCNGIRLARFAIGDSINVSGKVFSNNDWLEKNLSTCSSVLPSL